MTLSSQAHVKWLSWEDALQRNQKEKRKILVDVYTNWCGWCKKMDKTTFSDEKIAEYVNANYYPVKFNAEQREDIIFNNKIYKYVGSFGRKGYHELAFEIMRGKLSYPTAVFIDENLSVIQPISGFQDALKFEMIMIFFAENYYKTVPWNKFVIAFQKGNLINSNDPKSVQPKVQTVKN